MEHKEGAMTKQETTTERPENCRCSSLPADIRPCEPCYLAQQDGR